MDEDGKFLSLLEVVTFKEKGNDVQFKAFFPKTIYPLCQLRNNVTGFNYEMLEYAFNAVEGGVLGYLDRNIQVPVMRENGINYVGIFNKHQHDIISQHYPNYMLLPIEEFNRKFYQA